jgi:hypothetical protein
VAMVGSAGLAIAGLAEAGPVRAALEPAEPEVAAAYVLD